MPLEKIRQLLDQNATAIDEWFAKKWQSHQPLPYFSCDVRHASYKIGIVDTNLFPAGFNNLCPAFTKETAEAFAKYFDTYFADVKKIVLFGENHTRNKFYLLNLVKLKNLIEMTGRECRITLPLDAYPEASLKIPLDENHHIVIEEAQAEAGTLRIGDFKADLVLTNNDFSAGIPQILQAVTVPVIPSPQLGWFKRYKSQHFTILDRLVGEFSQTFGLDAWTMMPITKTVSGVGESNLGALTETVGEILQAIQKKYEQYQISETPYVFIKNDSGTYGLGIVTVSSVEELQTLNRKKRSKLFAAKNGAQTERFIVQEGIPTYDTYSGFPIEPVIYGVGHGPIGGFFRIHEDKNPFESLNAPGASFSCLCLHKLDEPHEAYFIHCKDKQRLVKAAKFLSRFASLAAAMEKSETQS